MYALTVDRRRSRSEGLRVCDTLDAGPNVHCVCVASDADELGERIVQLPGVERVLRASVGGGAEVSA